MRVAERRRLIRFSLDGKKLRGRGRRSGRCRVKACVNSTVDTNGHCFWRIVCVERSPLRSASRHYVIGLGDALLKLSFFIAFGAKTATLLGRLGCHVQVYDDVGRRQPALRGLTPLQLKPVCDRVDDTRRRISVNYDMSSRTQMCANRTRRLPPVGREQEVRRTRVELSLLGHAEDELSVTLSQHSHGVKDVWDDLSLHA